MSEYFCNRGSRRPERPRVPPSFPARRKPGPGTPSVLLRVLLLVTFAFLGSGCGKKPLFPVVVNGKWGFIDATGRIVIQPQFETARSPFDEVGAVRNGGVWLFVDPSGKTVKLPQYDQIGGFENGIAWVEKNGKWGCVDQFGKEVISPRFEFMQGFNDGYCAAKHEGKWGFINRKGEFVIEPQYIEAGSFSEGLAPVQLYYEHWIYIDKNGDQAIAKVFKEASEFSERLASVAVADGIFWTHGYIDKTGEFRIGPGFRTAWDFHSGLAPIQDSTDSWSFINQSGEVMIELGDVSPHVFVFGLAQIFTETGYSQRGSRTIFTGRFHYIDTKGDTVWSMPKAESWDFP
ncbi:MAG: WG repeat-containing protein [Candidatus Eisenbacteria bacterium]|nr:WG repeat-containing protein [Candidatus Eisenbacteria bacterium]